MPITVTLSDQEAQMVLGLLENVPMRGTQGMALVLSIQVKVQQGIALQGQPLSAPVEVAVQKNGA